METQALGPDCLGGSEFHGISDGCTSDHDHVRETTHTKISLRGSIPTMSPGLVPITGTGATQASPATI